MASFSNYGEFLVGLYFTSLLDSTQNRYIFLKNKLKMYLNIQ